MKNKKALVAIIVLLIVGVIGVTYAYYNSTTEIENTFKTGKYQNQVDEEFVSPDNWVPGDTTDKTITVTNTGTVDMAVRVWYEEKWTSATGDNLNVYETCSEDSSDIAICNGLSSGKARYAIINFSEDGNWIKDSKFFEDDTSHSDTNLVSSGYYYYKYKLAPEDVTTSLINSVTYNKNAVNGYKCNTEGGTTICNSTGDKYDGASYSLTFHIETVQYNAYSEYWETDVSITDKN